MHRVNPRHIRLLGAQHALARANGRQRDVRQRRPSTPRSLFEMPEALAVFLVRDLATRIPFRKDGSRIRCPLCITPRTTSPDEESKQEEEREEPEQRDQRPEP